MASEWWSVTVVPGTWRDQASCLGSGVDFFPDPSGDDYEDKVAEARALCALCPVKTECLDWARQPNGGVEPAERGVWGGENLDEVDGPVKRPCPMCLDEEAAPREVYCKGVCRRHYQRHFARRKR